MLFMTCSSALDTLARMRSILLGLLCAVMMPVAGLAAITYSIFQSAEPGVPGAPSVSAINLDFTVPSLITTNTRITGSDINSSGVTVDGQNLSLLSVGIDPGLGIGGYQVAPGIPWVALSFGLNGQQVFGEGVCFVPVSTQYPYGCAGPGATPFDHFGTYTHGDVTLTIASSDVPEPRFELAFGLCALLLLIGMGRWTTLLRSTKILTPFSN